jgi:hypothetical protein
MGRLVRKPQVPDFDSQVAGLNGVQSGLAGRQMVKADPADGYLERMVKYVPAEIIAFSMVINSILEQAMKSGGDHAAMAGVPVPVIAAVALVVACLLTPLFSGMSAGTATPGSPTRWSPRSPCPSGPISWALSPSPRITTATSRRSW